MDASAALASAAANQKAATAAAVAAAASVPPPPLPKKPSLPAKPVLKAKPVKIPTVEKGQVNKTQSRQGNVILGNCNFLHFGETIRPALAFAPGRPIFVSLPFSGYPNC